jgi:exopolyphosphatase/guanosine-5'-triphosphate,3'-diphosphate pyrophosphatase
MKLAAIDIGSNAARLLICEVRENGNDSPEFQKLNLVRVPLRLGFDVFEFRQVSYAREEMLVDTIKAFKLLMDVHQVDFMTACATSAMRDASNGPEIIERIKNETGVNIHIISGDTEAEYIYGTRLMERNIPAKSFLYIDVGGGSTEITLFENGELVYKSSHNIGTIRILKNQVSDDQWNIMKADIRKLVKNKTGKMVAIGSGGNINKVFSLSKRKEDKPLYLDTLKDYYKELSSVTVAERIRLYKLKEDRADVIVPALLIYINVLKWAEIEEIYVPKIGLADGLIRNLYSRITGKKP